MIDPSINLNGKTVLITGAAGFIGSFLTIELLKTIDKIKIVGIDNLNSYYDVSLKEARLKKIEGFTDRKDKEFIFIKQDISDKDELFNLFSKYRFDVVVNLAAQAGVRYSIENPDAYIKSNIIGFYNVLEAVRKYPVAHLVYASSSSVYGENKKIPYSVLDKTDSPVSLYAATKKSNELLAYSYSKLYKIPATGLRFFTVYGPMGRPDMAYFGFTDKLLKGKNIEIFNYGNCKRDFTYVDDIVSGIEKVMICPPKSEDKGGNAITPHRVYNIGNNHPEDLLEFVKILQEELVNNGLLSADYDFEGHTRLLPMQAGDVAITYADVSDLENDFGFKPETPLREGLKKFIKWYKEYY